MTTTISASCSTPTGGGRWAQAGRAKLRHDMMTPAPPSTEPSCDCAKCSPPPLDDIEAQRALRHVSNAEAAAYQRGELTLVSFHGCEDCGGWVPAFTEA